jgi:hypothetical protein
VVYIGQGRGSKEMYTTVGREETLTFLWSHYTDKSLEVNIGHGGLDGYATVSGEREA